MRKEVKKIVKSELIDKTFESLDNDVERYNTEKVINTFIHILANELKKGTNITLAGVGTFTHTTRKAHIGKNVNTGKIESIPETKYIRFKPSKNIKE